MKDAFMAFSAYIRLKTPRFVYAENFAVIFGGNVHCMQKNEDEIPRFLRVLRLFGAFQPLVSIILFSNSLGTEFTPFIISVTLS